MNITLIPNWQLIILIGLAVVFFGLWQWNWFRQRAYALMVQAKRLAKDEILKSGEDQEQWVVNMLSKIPWIMFIPRGWLVIAVKYLYGIAKDYCDDGKINNSI